MNDLEQKAKTLMQDLKVIFKTSGLGTRNLLFKDVFEFIEVCKKCVRRTRCHAIGCILDEEKAKP